MMPGSDWFDRSIVAPGVTRIVEPFVHSFFRANLYRIEGRDFDIQLDFGTGVSSLVGALGSTGKPAMAIATHAHMDHVGSFHEFERRAAHPLEAETFATMADDGTLASWFVAQEGALQQLPSPGYALAGFKLTPAPLTEMLGEGDIVDTGDRRFRILHVPGHSPGSIALLDEHSGAFFSGDAIYDDDLVDDVPGADVTVYLDTMRRLAELDISTGYGGHGESFDRTRMREIARGYIASKGG